jgi:hypothetical protein
MGAVCLVLATIEMLGIALLVVGGVEEVSEGGEEAGVA